MSEKKSSIQNIQRTFVLYNKETTAQFKKIAKYFNGHITEDIQTS